MRSEKPAGSKFKRICKDFPNMSVITKSATHGKNKLMYLHASVGKNFLAEKVTAFALEGSLEAPTMVLIGVERDFTGDGKKIRLLTAEVLLCTAVGDLAKSKNLQDWASMNSVLLPSFLTGAFVTDRETVVESLLKIFTDNINNHEADNKPEDIDKDKYIGSGEDKEKDYVNTRSTKGVTARDATNGIADNYNDIIAFIQAVALKAPQVMAKPLFMQADK